MSAVLTSSIGAYVFLIRIYIIGWLITWFHKVCAWLNIESKLVSTEEDAHSKSLLYTQTWEDPRVLRQALRLSDKDTVLSVASAGDSLFALLLDNPRCVVGVDSSYPQLALCYLKAAGIKALSYEEFRYFLGFTEEVADGRKRREIYRCSLRCHLLEETRDYWDHQEERLSYGVVHCGSWERFCRTFTGLVLPLTHDRRQVAAMLTQRGVSGQRELVSRDWTSLQWRALCRFYYSQAMMQGQGVGRHPAYRAMFQRADRPVTEQLLTRITENLGSVPVSGSNYFMEYFLTGGMTGAHSLPDYVQRENFSTLKARVDRLELVHAPLLDFLRDTKASGRDRRVYDAVHLSHLPDSAPDVKSLFREVLRSVKPGARVTHWKFLVDRDSESLFPKELRCDVKLSNSLKSEDRIFLYRDFVVQTCRVR